MWIDRVAPVIHPEGRLTRAFGWLSRVVKVYICVVVPLELAFDDRLDPDGAPLIAVNIVVDMVCLCSLVLAVHRR